MIVVATAVYEDTNTPQVEALLDFRDQVLMDSVLERCFVKFYYGGAGKKMAALIKNRFPDSLPVIEQVWIFSLTSISIRRNKNS